MDLASIVILLSRQQTTKALIGLCGCKNRLSHDVAHIVMHPKDADRMANSADPDQTERSSLIWVITVCLDLSVRKLWVIQTYENLQPIDRIVIEFEQVDSTSKNFDFMGMHANKENKIFNCAQQLWFIHNYCSLSHDHCCCGLIQGSIIFRVLSPVQD